MPGAGSPRHQTSRPVPAADGELQDFIEHVIVPALVDRWFQHEDPAGRRDTGGHQTDTGP